MRVSPFTAPLELPLQPSRYLLAYTAGVHVLAAGVVLLLVMRCPWASLMWGVVAASLLLAWRRLTLAGASAVHRVVYLGDGRCRWWDAGGARHDGTARPSLVHPLLVVLQLRAAGRARQHVLLAPDSLPADALRQLRVRLRLAPGD